MYDNHRNLGVAFLGGIVVEAIQIIIFSTSNFRASTIACEVQEEQGKLTGIKTCQ